MSTTSESDEEEKKKLLESVNGFELEQKNVLKKTGINSSKYPKPSLRHKNDIEVNNALLATPEFKSFVAKKLDHFLASEIQDVKPFTDKKEDVSLLLDEQQHGVKLLGCSKNAIGVEELAKLKPKKRKRPSISSSDDDNDEELKKLQSAAVTYDFVMKDSAIPLHTELPKKKKKKKKKETTANG